MPIGPILVLLALVAGYQIFTRLPAALAGGLAVMIMALISAGVHRTSDELRAVGTDMTPTAAPRSLWAAPDARIQRLQRRGAALAVRQTEFSALFPDAYAPGDAMGQRIAQWRRRSA